MRTILALVSILGLSHVAAAGAITTTTCVTETIGNRTVETCTIDMSGFERAMRELANETLEDVDLRTPAPPTAVAPLPPAPKREPKPARQPQPEEDGFASLLRSVERLDRTIQAEQEPARQRPDRPVPRAP